MSKKTPNGAIAVPLKRGDGVRRKREEREREERERERESARERESELTKHTQLLRERGENRGTLRTSASSTSLHGEGRVVL